jgi:hypothetical protein
MGMPPSFSDTAGCRIRNSLLLRIISMPSGGISGGVDFNAVLSKSATRLLGWAGRRDEAGRQHCWQPNISSHSLPCQRWHSLVSLQGKAKGA